MGFCDRLGEKVKLIFCNKCVICFAAIVVIILAGTAIAAHYVATYVNSRDGDAQNKTAEEESALKEFYETWEAPKELREKMPHKFLGFDKENRPVWLAEYGKWDMPGLLEDAANLEILQTMAEQSIYRVQQSMRIRSTSEKPVTTFALIIDMNGQTWSKAFHPPTISFMGEMAEKHRSFLLTVEYGFIINMGTLADFVVTAMRPFVGNVLDKFETLGYDKDTWMPLILEHVPASQLPEAYGGYPNFTALASYR